MLSTVISNFRLEVFLAKRMTVFVEMWSRSSLSVYRNVTFSASESKPSARNSQNLAYKI